MLVMKTGNLTATGSCDRLLCWSTQFYVNQRHPVMIATIADGWDKITNGAVTSTKRRAAETGIIIESQKARMDELRANVDDSEDAKRPLRIGSDRDRSRWPPVITLQLRSISRGPVPQ